jgi:guanylate kinase
MMLPIPHPVFFLVSAPSGAGKTTLCKRLLAASPELRYSVSCTTRPPRQGETDGTDYVFLTRAAFEEKIRNGDFLEHAEVYGNYYGTRRDFVVRELRGGHSVLLDVDVQGAEKIRAALRDPSVDPILRQTFCDVFVHPPSEAVLRERIERRGKDSAEVIERRLAQARNEILHAAAYQFQFQNQDLDQAADLFRAIYLSARHRTAD